MPSNVDIAFDDPAIDRLAGDGYVVVDGWLGRSGAVALRGALVALLEDGCFAAARIGAGSQLQEAPEVRRDSVCWFDADADSRAGDGRTGVRPGPRVRFFLARMELLRERLNRACFLSLSDVECHAACYEPGGFYAAHLDTPTDDSRRIISFSHYLSERDSVEAGGCLRVHGEDGKHVDIEPCFDRLVLFRSRSVLHEVMPVASRRFSMTGWMSSEGRHA